MIVQTLPVIWHFLTSN